MSIILVRLPEQAWSYGTSLARPQHCRLDPCSAPGGAPAQHAAFVDDAGVLHYQHVDASGHTTTLLQYQLQYRASPDTPYEPMAQPWAFEFVPSSPGDLLLVQAGSCRILYASMPRRGATSSDVFLFGSHTAPITCLRIHGSHVLSGCADGALKLWRLADGQLADAVASAEPSPQQATVTAIEVLGPLLVAVGTTAGNVSIYDTAAGRLLAVQRLAAAPGAVSCLAGWLPPELLDDAHLAGAGPRVPDGSGVLPGPGVGAGFREQLLGMQQQTHGRQQQHALLAVASSSGWLCVYAASAPGSNSWSLLHSTGSLLAAGACALAFTPDGCSLAVGSPAAQLLGLEAAAIAAAGGQPGTVSLYQLASGSASSAGGDPAAALLPPLLLEQQQRRQQQQLPELQLWHQWSLSSAPVALIMLPGSGFSLLHAKQLQATQVVQVLAVLAAGSSVVLKAERALHPQEAHSERGPAAQQAGAPSSSSAPQRQQLSLSGHSASEDEELLLNRAERDLAEVASAIAAAAGPLGDAELSALLAGLGSDLTAAGQATQAAATEAAAAAEEAAGALRVPRTLPSLRSWKDPGAAPEPEAAAGRLAALAAELQREQEEARLLKQEQQAAAQEEEAAQQQQQQEEQEEAQDAALEEDVDASLGASSPAAPATGAHSAPAAEHELPCESSFQHLLQPGGGHAAPCEEQQQHEVEEQEERNEDAAALAGSPAPSPAAPPPMLAVNDGSSADAAEPRPRALPPILRQQQQPAAPLATDASQLWSMPPPPVAQQAEQPQSQQPQQQQRHATLGQHLSLRREQQQQQREALHQVARESVAAAAAAAAAAGRPAPVPASDHPLAAVARNSSRMLAQKIKEAERPPVVSVDPSGPAALRVAAARLGDLDLGPDQQQYSYDELADLRDLPTPTAAPRLVPKQLDAHWLASRSLKPSLDTLFSPEEWQQSYVDPQVLVLPAWPSASSVVEALLWPGGCARS